MKDYYRILEVEPISTHEVIKTNFRRLAKVYHPDISKSNFTADKFIEITEAYEVLSDATKRAKYNFYYNNAQNNQQNNKSYFRNGKILVDKRPLNMQNVGFVVIIPMRRTHGLYLCKRTMNTPIFYFRIVPNVINN